MVSRHQNTQQYGGILPIELTTKDIKNTKAYKEYYACATGEAAPKPKASARRKRSDSDTSITPLTAIPTLITTVTAAPRLTAATKGKQPVKAKSPSDPSEVARIEAEQLKIVLKRSRQETYFSANNDEGDKNDESDDGKEYDDDDDNDDEQDIAKIDEPKDTESGGGDEKESKNDEESDDEETREEESFDPIPKTPEDSKDDGNGKEDQGLRISEEERIHEEEEADELYRDVNINQGRGLQVSHNIEDSHVTLTSIHPDGQQESSSVSSFVTSILNPISDAGVEFIFTTASYSVAPLPTPIPTMTPSIITTITTASHPPIPSTPIPSKQIHLLKLSRASWSVNAQLEYEVLTRSSHSSRTSYAIAADLSEMELKKILIEKMEGNKYIQRSDEQRNLYKALVDAYEADKTILDSYEETTILKRRREDYDDQSAGRSTTGSKSRQASASESTIAEEPVQTISQIKESSHPVFETGAGDQPIVQTSQHPEWFPLPKKPPTLDHDWIKTLPALGVDTLTPELLAGPTYELIRGSCNNLTDLEYHMEKVYKVITDQLDRVNPEGQQYPHNLLQPLPLIPDNRGHRVILFSHFINNDLEYLWGGSSSRKYTTSVTKTKAADYGHIKWIEDLFYRVAINRESALDVYSKRRIIVVTNLKIIEWHNYKHLDWISIHRDDDKIYKFKEGDFKWLRLEDIEDMLLLLVQGKLSNLTVEEHFALTDGTLNDVRNALDDRLKGIRMQYLPQTIWRKGDKDRAAAMIQAIDKMLKTRRIMRSLERFVGGRLYEEKSKKLGRVLTEMELILEHTQQGIRDVLLMLEILSGKFFLKLNLSDHRSILIDLQETLKRRRRLVILQRVLRIILVILPEHPSDTYVFTMKMEILLESTSNKLMVGHKNDFVSDLLIDFQIKFSLSIGEIVTHWFTLIVLSALRRSGNENMLGLVNPHGFAGNIKREWRYLFPVEPQVITTCSYPTNQDFRYSDVFKHEGKINAECYRARYHEEGNGMQHFEDLDKRKFGRKM
nr:hypothetical protein [Tanacetum cinerariifolium]